MFKIIGFGFLMLWSVGFIAPFTFFGFIQIFLATALLNYLLRKIASLKISIKNRKAAKTIGTSLKSSDNTVQIKSFNF
ncbi:MAG TPA: hypothetical protein VK870_12285 [Ignavibacteriaceae bacterium]|nr:hypothetical protein [Ignavibacteriaceae bacterium]